MLLLIVLGFLGASEPLPPGEADEFDREIPPIAPPGPANCGTLLESSTALFEIDRGRICPYRWGIGGLYDGYV